MDNEGILLLKCGKSTIVKSKSSRLSYNSACSLSWLLCSSYKTKYEVEFVESVVSLMSSSWEYIRSILSLNLELFSDNISSIYLNVRFNCFTSFLLPFFDIFWMHYQWSRHLVEPTRVLGFFLASLSGAKILGCETLINAIQLTLISVDLHISFYLGSIDHMSAM